MVKPMKIVFWSNTYTRHQEALCHAFASRTEQFMFIAETEETRPMELMGKEAMEEPSFVSHVRAENRKKLIRLVSETADTVILGVPAPDLVYACCFRKVMVFRYSERPFKKEMTMPGCILRAVRWRCWNPPGASIYMLCAGAYTATDYLRIGMFRNRTYKWGYFSEFKRRVSIESLMSGKDYKQILWAGRLLSWKHPERALYLAKELAAKGISFRLRLIGSGPLKKELESLFLELKLQHYVEMQELVDASDLRSIMEQSGIFLMTSDREEGWGAVVNEAMSCGCAVIGSSKAGSVPFLIESGVNGYIFDSDNKGELTELAEELLKSPWQQRKIGEMAVHTIEKEWNAEEAADRFIKLADSIRKKHSAAIFKNGPCSRA